jgi:hypothetical protein
MNIHEVEVPKLTQELFKEIKFADPKYKIIGIRS